MKYLGLVDFHPEMVDIPLGKDGIFEMGSPETEWSRYSDQIVHKVKISANYKMATTPVTFSQYSLYCEAKDRSLDLITSSWNRYGDHPVVNVNWYDAVEYCCWLNEQYGLAPAYQLHKEKNSDTFNKVSSDYQKWLVHWQADAKGFRLPTEAEWELAARGGVPAQDFLFAGSNNADEVAWYQENSSTGPNYLGLDVTYDSNMRSHFVKEKKSNSLGIFDMSGNVYEWCWDWYAIENCIKKGLVKNQKGPQEGHKGRVIRGGSWLSSAQSCRTVSRSGLNPNYHCYDLGFRVVFIP